MPEINNPQVVLFANERVRTIADSLYSAYFRSKSILEDYASGQIGSLIDSAGASELVADGSDSDGRTRITGGDIYNIITALEQFVNFIEGQAVTTADRTDVISKPHVNQF
jgi:hypothetical protein